MAEPWHRDAVLTAMADPSNQDAVAWAKRIAYTYGKSGSLEVTGVICALLDTLNAAACVGHQGGQ